MAAGVVGAFVGTPAEVALIRMTADGRLPPAERRNYKNVFDSLFRIVKEEGVFTLWRGALPTMGRAMVVNAAQLASYSQAKQFLLDTGQIVVLIAFTINEVTNIFFFTVIEKLDTLLWYVAKHSVGTTGLSYSPFISVVLITEKYYV